MIKEKFFSRRNFNLIREFTATDFKLSYKNSLLGYLWSFLSPLLTFGVLYFVFTIFVRFDLPHYQLYLLLGIILWNFLSSATQSSLDSILSKAVLIRKAAFPRMSIVVASVLTSFITLLLNLLIFLAFLLFNGLRPGIQSIYFIFLLAELFLLTTGLSLLLAASYVRFRDIAHIWQVFLQVGFWLTPIVYPTGIIPQRFLWLVLLNPIAQLIMTARQVLIYGQELPPGLAQFSSPAYAGFTFIFSLAVFGLGIFYFNRRSRSFAEEV